MLGGLVKENEMLFLILVKFGYLIFIIVYWNFNFNYMLKCIEEYWGNEFVCVNEMVNFVLVIKVY